MKYLTAFFFAYSAIMCILNLYSGSFVWAAIMSVCAYFNYQSLRQYRF